MGVDDLAEFVEATDCNYETEVMLQYILNHESLVEMLKGQDAGVIADEVFRFLWRNGDAAMATDISWAEVCEFFADDADNVTPLPERSRTIDEVARDVIERGLSAEEAVREVVAAHQVAIELVLDTLDDQAKRLDRLKKQVNTLVQVHGT